MNQSGIDNLITDPDLSVTDLPLVYRYAHTAPFVPPGSPVGTQPIPPEITLTLVDVVTDPEKSAFYLVIEDYAKDRPLESHPLAQWDQWGDKPIATFFAENIGDIMRELDKEPSASARFVLRADNAAVVCAGMTLSKD